MPDQEFIHAGEDVSAVLSLADELGLVVREDAPTNGPEPNVVTPARFSQYRRGVFALYRPDWVFGDLQFTRITGGHNNGKYTLSPRVNCTSITVYFGGERFDGISNRLGGGVISSHLDWLRTRDRTVQRAPQEVTTVYSAILARLDVGKRVQGGGHNYMVLGAAWRELVRGSTIPPFDFIEWPDPAPE